MWKFALFSLPPVHCLSLSLHGPTICSLSPILERLAHLTHHSLPSIESDLSLLSLFSLFNHLSTIFKTYCPPQILPLLILISFFKIIQNYLPLKSSFRMFSFLSQVSFILFLDPTPTFIHISLSLSLSTFTHSQFPQSMSCRRIIFKRQRYSYSLSKSKQYF